MWNISPAWFAGFFPLSHFVRPILSTDFPKYDVLLLFNFYCHVVQMGLLIWVCGTNPAFPTQGLCHTYVGIHPELYSDFLCTKLEFEILSADFSVFSIKTAFLGGFARSKFHLIYLFSERRYKLQGSFPQTYGTFLLYSLLGFFRFLILWDPFCQLIFPKYDVLFYGGANFQ